MNYPSLNKRYQKRLRHHLLIAAASLFLSILIYAVLLQFYPDSSRRMFRWSMTTGYAAIVLLAVTLSLGAWNVLRGRVNPVSSDLRRDAGIWCGIFSLAHVAFGLNVHLQRWTQYFIDDAGKWRTDAFGLANYTGVAAALVAAALLATSNDVSLRFFKRERWKAIQRWNYVFVVLVVLHGVVYQYVEKRLLPYVFYIGAIALWMLAFQFAGFRKKRRQTPTAAAIPES